MTKTHGKTLKLQQITVKVPGQRVSSVSKVTPTGSIASDLADSLIVAGNQSDRSNSNSPIPLDSSLEISYSSANQIAPPGLRLIAPSFEYNLRDYRSQLTPEHEEFSSSERFDELVGVYHPPPPLPLVSNELVGVYNPPLPLVSNGRGGHNRNNSLDDNNVSMLQQLRTGGKHYLYSAPCTLNHVPCTVLCTLYSAPCTVLYSLI